MLTMFRLSTLLQFVALIGQCHYGQTQIQYFSAFEVGWNELPAPSSPVNQGNGAFIPPDDSVVVVTGADGVVRGFAPRTGAVAWVYNPPTPGLFASRSGVTFSYTSLRNYMVFSIVRSIDTPMATTSVVALSPTGTELWTSPELAGQASGTPVVSESGQYVFLTHNSASGTVGHFTILDATANGTVFFSEFNTTEPYSPPAIFFTPEEGYYDNANGVFNINDLLIWSTTPRPTDTIAGFGQVYGFQFPSGFTGSNATLAVLTLNNFGDTQPRNWVSIAPPAITNRGRSLYWGVSRNQLRAWNGMPGVARPRFSRANTAIGTTGRGNPPRQAIFATPTLSSDPIEPFVFVGTANNFFLRTNFDISQNVSVPVTTPVRSRAVLSPDEELVYYMESGGILHQAYATNLTDRLTQDITRSVLGEIAQLSDGSMIFIATTIGVVTGFRVAPAVTSAPTIAPTMAPTMIATTATPTMMPTMTPTMAPTQATPAPTAAPTGSAATPAPTSMPTVSTPAPTGVATPGSTPAPTASTPAPTVILTAPPTAAPTVTGATPAPTVTGATPAPTVTGATPAPTGATPAPTGATPAPTGATPAPTVLATPMPSMMTPAPTVTPPSGAACVPVFVSLLAGCMTALFAFWV